MNHLSQNYYEAASVILFGVGFATLVLQKNLIKKIIGLNVMDSSVFLFITAKGFVNGAIAPIIVEGVTEATAYTNPVPGGLVLTGIVVSVSVTAFALALTIRFYKEYGSLDLDEIAYKSKLKKEIGQNGNGE